MDRQQRERRRPDRDTLPWDAFIGYDVSAAQLEYASESKDEIFTLRKPKRRGKKRLTTKTNRAYWQRSLFSARENATPTESASKVGIGSASEL
jgi:hypothetical protein